MRSVNCCDCGCDVTGQADSDGKADELKSIALYLCPACAQKCVSGQLPVERIKDYRLLTQFGEGGFGMPETPVYAMVIAFYNSVTGQFPYDFPSREECARMVRRGERPCDPISFILGDDKPIPIEKRLPGIDRNVARAVNAAIVKDEKKRIGIAEFVRALA